MLKRKSARGKIVGLSAVLVLCIGLFVFLCVWFFGARYPAFFGNAEEEAEIPGLADGISPQGLCPVPENAEGYEFAMSGYMADGSPSRVYLIGKEGHKFVTLTEEGKDVTAHFGGVTCTGEDLLVASGKTLLRVPFSAVLGAESGGKLQAERAVQTDINVAYCYFNADTQKLYAGEFYREKNYKTNEDHHLTVNGETNYAFIYEYSFENGAIKETPDKVISVRALVQGIAVYGDNITLSTSYGLADSVFYTYGNILNGEANGTAEVGGKEIPLYRLDSSNLKSALAAPCMSEEIFVRDGRIYILFESLCVKYKYFVRTRIDSILSLPLSGL